MTLDVWRSCGSRTMFLRAWLDSAPWRRPPPVESRCAMGSTVDPAVWCRRDAGDSLWCERHAPPMPPSGETAE